MSTNVNAQIGVFRPPASNNPSSSNYPQQATGIPGQTVTGPAYQTSADNWALKMFSEAGTVMTHHFGDLALHAEAEHRFRFRNIYKEDVEILSAQASCTCTMVTVSKKVIKSGEIGEIIARVDTSGKVHTGRRKATITVYFKQPKVAEVQMQVDSFIRSDVVFEPGVVEFGGVGEGNLVSKKVYLHYRGGSPNWKVKGLKKTNPAIRAVSRLVSNQPSGKTYEVEITLMPTAEPGYVNDILHFTTNDTGSAHSIFIPIHGLVYSALSAKPSCLQFGVLHSGESVTKNLVVRGSMPFRIKTVTSTDTRITFQTADRLSVIHVIPVTFREDGTGEPGEFHGTISIKTTLEELPQLDVAVFGMISDKEKDFGENPDSARSTVETSALAWGDYQKMIENSESIPVLGVFREEMLTASSQSQEDAAPATSDPEPAEEHAANVATTTESTPSEPEMAEVAKSEEGTEPATERPAIPWEGKTVVKNDSEPSVPANLPETAKIVIPSIPATQPVTVTQAESNAPSGTSLDWLKSQGGKSGHSSYKKSSRALVSQALPNPEEATDDYLYSRAEPKFQENANPGQADSGENGKSSPLEITEEDPSSTQLPAVVTSVVDSTKKSTKATAHPVGKASKSSADRPAKKDGQEIDGDGWFAVPTNGGKKPVVKDENEKTSKVSLEKESSVGEEETKEDVNAFTPPQTMAHKMSQRGAFRKPAF